MSRRSARRWLPGLAAAVAVVAAAALTLSGLERVDGAGHGLQDDNPYPEVNPCASGVSEISGTIKVCTLIRESGETRVYTQPRRAMVWIQISETGPTAHVSDTVDGIAFVRDREGIPLTQRDDWYVSIQTWNLPPGVELESRLVFTRVRVNEARTFVFACLSPPCNQPAPTATATPTVIPPGFTPSATSTATVSGTATVSPTTIATVAATTETPTPAATGAPTALDPTLAPTSSAEPTSTQTPSLTPTAPTIEPTVTQTVPPVETIGVSPSPPAGERRMLFAPLVLCWRR